MNANGAIFFTEITLQLSLAQFFRKIKDDNTSLTFGIDIGWSNATYKSKVSNDFTGRIRRGIPFNIYSKKKEDKTKK
ncbi:hypothetical protein Q4603_09650 [Zobellia galactanivorans]|uniref:hypothetical protein n=1 Tax=Zobellia galactanivorans (strain DSM 12802 / CCUG 47099 / CIP 106680 / NCIMB 13871 / Dsij) TaxID=63186 RepID=UPI0026E2360A|nr:hypothetical protein [Zobellia galactanivorans]MDO6808876.1 hypothetical protein [Zobellia galactanivorans]